MRLDELAAIAGAHRHDPVAGQRHIGADSRDPEVVDCTHDSRQVRPGWLFCCLPGTVTDGHVHAPAALAAGASALLVERPLDVPVPQLQVASVRAVLGRVADAVHGSPSAALRVVGVTGTNGKTTTAWLVRSLLEHAGWRCGMLGTLTGARTTPEAPDLHRALAGFRAEGCTAVAMEVSSHALALHRTDGTRFAVGVFTNLGRDHLDFHGTMDAYFAAKARLFDAGACAVGVVNSDDAWGRRLRAQAGVPVTTYGLADAAALELGPTRSRFSWRGHRVELPLGGAFNVCNALAALEAVVAAGVEPATAAAGLGSVPPVPGRFEAVEAGQPFAVIVDYAHTPEGLEAVLDAARTATAGRVVVVFGCGGDRDAHKRPKMGSVAAERADVVVLTSDNPRSEDPAAIIAAVLDGIAPPHRSRTVVEPDRRAAIAIAITEARPGDVVVIAGKGHETAQDLGPAGTIPFDDRVVARALLEARS